MQQHSLPHPRSRFNQLAHPRPGTGQKLVAHYILNGRVVCEAARHLTAATRLMEVPIPVRHRLMMGVK